MAFDEFRHLHDIRQSDDIPYFSFYDTNGELITGDSISVTFDDNGQFDTLTVIKDGVSTVYQKGTYTYTTECLYVLGIGFLIPGDIVKLHIDSIYTYELNYGWHTNVSDQTIYSWFLKRLPVRDPFIDERKGFDRRSEPNIKENGILTFYKEYLDTIEVVSFTKNRNSFDWK